MKTILVALVALVMAWAYQALGTVAQPADSFPLYSSRIGCPTLTAAHDLEKGDIAAARIAGCIGLDKNTVVVMPEVLGEFGCLRPQGKQICYWTKLEKGERELFGPGQ